MASFWAYKDYLVDVYVDSLRNGEFSSSFFLHYDHGESITGTGFFPPGTFPTEKAAILHALSAAKRRIDSGFVPVDV